MATAETKDKRRPKARNSQIVLGALEECLLAVARSRDLETVHEHLKRVDELIDEMKRSFGKKDVTVGTVDE